VRGAKARETRNPQVLSRRECRKAQLLRTLNPLILAVSLKAGIERSTVENARQRQKTLYPLVSSKARRGTIDCQECSAEAKNECSTPLETRFALGSGAGSVLQTQRIRMLVGERSEIFLKRLSFYIVKIACFPTLLGFVSFPHAVWILWSEAFGERDAYWRRS